MKFKNIIAFVGVLALTVFAYAASTNQVSHVTDGMLAQGGSSGWSAGSRTVVVSASTNLEYAIEAKVCTIGTITNTMTFSPVFLADPAVVYSGRGSNFIGGVLTVASNAVTLVLNSNATNDTVSMIAYGYKRSGVTK